MAFKKFTSIEKFSDVWAKAQKYDIGELQFRSKIKLHGTNAGVRVENGTVTAQKRTEDVTPLRDNAGFAFWVSSVDWKTDKNVIIYGEWAGPGVQKSDAVSLIPRKQFFVFGVLLLDNKFDEDGEIVEANYVICPDLIRAYLPEHADIHVLPWFDEPMTMHSDDIETARAIQETVEKQVEQIGEEDPYIKEKFGVSGGGEGLVIAPYVENGVLHDWIYNSYVFKVKSEAHAVKKTKSPASVQVEVPSDVKDFADTFVTDARCQQMIDEHCGGSTSPKVIGEFLKAINGDILKESTNELAALGVEWKMVAKEINKRAVAWINERNKV